MSRSDYKNIYEGYLDNTKNPRYENFDLFGSGIDFSGLSGLNNIDVSNMNITDENITNGLPQNLKNFSLIKKTPPIQTIISDAAGVAKKYAKDNNIDFYEYHFNKNDYQTTIVIDTYKGNTDDSINTNYYLKTLDNKSQGGLLKLNKSNTITSTNPSLLFELKIKHLKNGESIGYNNYNPFENRPNDTTKYIYKKHPGRKNDYVKGYSELYIELQSIPNNTVNYAAIKLCADNYVNVSKKKEICIFISYS
jgi:hypothetical protein